MKTLNLFLLLLVFPTVIQAQYQPKSLPDRKAWANRTYKEAISKQDTALLAEAYYLFGKIEEITTANYLRTKVWYLKSLDLLEKIPPGFELSRIHLRLGTLEREQGNFDSTFKKYHKALYLSDSVKSNRAKVNALAHLGMFYADYWGDHPFIQYDSAAWYYREAEKIARVLRSKEGLAEIAIAKDKLSRAQGKITDPSRIKRVTLHVTGQENITELRAQLRLAEIYADTRDFTRSFNALTKAKDIFRKHFPHSLEAERMIERAEIRYFEKSGNRKAAMELREVKSGKEKLRNAQNQAGEGGELTEALQTEIIMQNLEQELKLHQENFLLQERSITLMTLLLGFAALFAVIFYLLYRKNREISRQNALLVKEQSHRFRNNLQVVSDLLSMQTRRVIDAEAAKQAIEESQVRLNAMSVLHSKLYQKDQLNAIPADPFFRELITGVLNTFALTHVKVNYSLSPVELSPDEALSLGLILTELTTNACKYAFKDHPDPQYDLQVTVSGNDLRMRINDNGRHTREPSGASFGMKIIALQVRQLHGEYHFRENRGLEFEMNYKRAGLFTRIKQRKPKTV